MAESTGTPKENLVSAPIIPSLPEIESARDPLASLKTPAPYIRDFGSLMPPVPNGVPVNTHINEQLQGDYNTGPNPGAKASNLQEGTLQYVKAVSDYMKDENTVRDRYKYGRSYSYGAGHKNMNFDRYYNHPKFEELGFNPYRDNDAFYNERSSWWDDFNRMSTQWGSLAWAGFSSMWSDESESNEAFERAMAIGTSTKDGFGASVTNFALNSAYTVGVMTEIALEDLALLGIEALSFGTATPEVAAVGAVRNTMAFGRLAKAWKGTHNFLKGLSSAEHARDFYNAAKAWQTTKDIAKWMNPMQRTFDNISDLTRGVKGMEQLGTKAKMVKSFGQFYRDIREMNVAHSEALLEGEGAMSQFQDQMIDEFYAEHGRMPDGKEAEEIYQRANSLKGTVTLANDLTIYYSNKLVFEDLFEGFRPGSKLAETFLEGSGRYLKKTAPAGYKVGQDIVQAGTKTGWKKTADFLTKSAYVPWSRKYFVGNLGEALQENAQEVITQSALDYYDKIYKDPTQIGFYGTLASIGKGTSEQFSAQGLETFLSGFLMGGLIQGPQAAMMGAYRSIKGENKEARAQMEQNDNDILNAANHVGRNALIYGDYNVDMGSAMRAANTQKKKANQVGDEKTSQDMTDELQIQYMNKLAKTGNMALITDHVDDMLTLDDKDLADAYNLSEDNAPEIRRKLSTLKERAEGYERKYKYAKAKMPNPYNPWMFAKKDKSGNLVYKEAFDTEMDRYKAHESAVDAMLFATEDYERISGRMASIGQNLAGQGTKFKNLINVLKGGTPVANAAASDVSLLVDPVEMMQTVKGLDDQIAVLKTGTPEQKREAEKMQKQRDLMIDWIQTVDHYKREMVSDRKAQSSPEEAAKRKQAARVRPGAIVRDKKGNEYKVESVKNGKATVMVNGKPKRFNRTSLEVIKDAKGAKPMEFEQVEGDDLSFAISQMYDSYNNYLRHVAEMKKGYIFDDQLNEAFKQIKDFYALENDALGMVSTINALNNPEYFKKYTEIQARVEAIKRERKLANLKEALNKFKEVANHNKFLNALYDLGVFVLPEDVEALKDFNVVDFYDVASKEMVPYNSEKYKQILDLIDEYAEKAGRITKGKSIPEAGKDAGAAERGKYNAQARKKLANDRRTYADHAKQFGFDPNSASSKVPTETVLKAIVASKYATAAEKALAKRLLSTAKPGSTITFVNNLSTPGVYSKEKGSVVDARYASLDYSLGEKGHPIEHVILHEYLHELTVEGLDTDPQFKADIEKLLAAAREYMASKEGKAEFGEKPLYGTMNAAEFIAEINNPVFQAMLQKIPYTVTGKVSSVWDEFMGTLKTFLKRLLGIKIEGTALDEALHIITAKIDKVEAQPTPQAQQKAGGTTLGPTDVVTGTTPIALLQTTEAGRKLVDDLFKGYLDYLNENEKPIPDMSPEQIMASEGFKTFMAESGTAAGIIQAFNKDRAPKGPTQTTAPKKKAQPNIWAIGNRKLFTGEVAGEMLTQVPIEIMEYSEYVDSDTKETVKEVVARNLNTGEPIMFDLNSEEAKDFLYPELPSTVKPEDVISDEVYNQFIDTGDVPMEILETIARKIKTNTPLSTRENAIFSDMAQTKKINDILAQEAASAKRDYKGITVIEDLNIVNKKGELGAAQFDRKNNVIRLNPVLMRQKFDEKAWTSPYEQKDGSKATPLPASTFASYEEFEAFVLEHEFQHTLMSFDEFKAVTQGKDKKRKVTLGEYEDYINDQALNALGILSEAEEEATEDLMEQYNNITNKTELDAWKEAALDVIGSSSMRDALSKELGVDFNGDYVKKLIADKEKGLAMSLTFEALTPGKVVLMKNGKVMVVKETTAKDVILVTPEVYKTGDPTAGKTIIAKGAIGSQIKMIHSEFMDKAEQEAPLTPEEVEDSNKAVEVAKDMEDAEEASKELEKDLEKKPEELDKELGDAIDECFKNPTE